MTETQPQGGNGRGPSDIEGRDAPTKQVPGYNEDARHDSDPAGDADQMPPSWQPGDAPANTPVNSGMQGEGEPGRAQRDSTGGVEGSGGGG
jgi:hypothetical protein